VCHDKRSAASFNFSIGLTPPHPLISRSQVLASCNHHRQVAMGFLASCRVEQGGDERFVSFFLPFHCFVSTQSQKKDPLPLSVPASPLSSLPSLFSNARNRTRSKEREEKQEEKKKKNLTAFPTNDIVGNGRRDLQLSFTIPGTDGDVQRRKSRPSFCKNRIGWGVNSTSFFFLPSAQSTRYISFSESATAD